MNTNIIRTAILIGVLGCLTFHASAQSRRVIRTPQPSRVRRVVPVQPQRVPQPQRVQVRRVPVRTPAPVPKYRLKEQSPTPAERSESEEAKSKKDSTKTKQPDSFESDLWSYLERTKYQYWSPGPGETDGFYNAQDPHGPFVKKYINRKAAGNMGELPSGSILVTENFNPNRTLNAITVMFKVEGYNPDASDWYWIAYNPDGTVARTSEATGKVPVAGAVESCINCHKRAEGGDYTYSND
ncbi:MAG: cytochrome P460 family protein [Planctomycetota bacterium]